MNNALYWYLYGMPLFVLVFAFVFARVSMHSIENSSRRAYRNLIANLEALRETMRERIADAERKNITTEPGAARARRLIAGATESIEHAKNAIARDPKAQQTWSTVARELKIAEKMLNHVPIALAGELDLPLPDDRPPVLD